jgi:hypothetical protein
MKNLPTPLIAVAIFTLLFLLERFFPLRKTTRSLIARLLVNVVIAVLTFIAAVGLVQPAARWALGWSASKGFGLTDHRGRGLLPDVHCRSLSKDPRNQALGPGRILPIIIA